MVRSQIVRMILKPFGEITKKFTQIMNEKNIRHKGWRTPIMKRKLLLIMPNFFDYPQAICEELEKMGYEVDCF